MAVCSLLSQRRTSLLTSFRQSKRAYRILIVLGIIQICALFAIISRSYVKHSQQFEESSPYEINHTHGNLSHHKIVVIKKPFHLSSTVEISPQITHYDIEKLLHSEIALSDLDMNDFYVPINSTFRCYRDGISELSKDVCHCKQTFHGKDCGIPSSAWFNQYGTTTREEVFFQRNTSRRIINAFPFNHEFDMLEARFSELENAVDIFILLEGSISSFGQPKPLRFLESVQRGRYVNVLSKLIYLNMSSIPTDVLSSGWKVEEYTRLKLGVEGLPRIKGIRDDDIIIISDADEIPSKDTVNFLKLYDGYTEPIFFTLKWNIFGFFWKYRDKQTYKTMSPYSGLPTIIGSACTIRIFIKVYKRNAAVLRKRKIFNNATFLQTYREYLGKQTFWTIGSVPYYAGWHCSWCFRPNDILIKLDSAQSDDKPRWGNFPEKRNLTYLSNIRRQGIWFDGTKLMESIAYYKLADLMPSAPAYFLENYQRFKYLFVADLNFTSDTNN